MQTIGISPPEAATDEITITMLKKLQFWQATITYKQAKSASISPYIATLVPVHSNDIRVKYRKFDDPYSLISNLTKRIHN